MSGVARPFSGILDDGLVLFLPDVSRPPPKQAAADTSRVVRRWMICGRSNCLLNLRGVSPNYDRAASTLLGCGCGCIRNPAEIHVPDGFVRTLSGGTCRTDKGNF